MDTRTRDGFRVKQPTTLSDRVRAAMSGFTTAAGMTVHQWGVHPDTITIIGLVMVAIAAVFVARGYLQVGGVILLLSLPLDALDGAVARAMERKDQVGAILDSTLDRYADGLIFGGVAYYFAAQNELHYMLLALASLVGSFVVSYVRARAGEADLSVKVGWFTRFERVVVILVMLLIPPLLVPGVALLAIGTNISSAQRLWYVYKHLAREVK